VEDGLAIAKLFQPLLGYLNFSTGKPDPRAQAKVFEVWERVAGRHTPWLAMAALLQEALGELQNAGTSGFHDAEQATAVIDLALVQLAGAYRKHHADLLAHQTDAELFQAGFCVRAVEAVLAEQGPWGERERILQGALRRLNDFVGHRPIAVLETRPQGEPYEHERLCPLPLYLQGAGVAPGRYRELTALAVGYLQNVPEEFRVEAYFDFDHLQEFAYDPRAYCHQHPADRRPNYRFGEWDPHHIDGRGFYRRMVVRQMILDSLLERTLRSSEALTEELLHEAALVLAGTMLMASGISGAGPDTHQSTVNLAHLMPRIAHCRDGFYAYQLERLPEAHRRRLQKEAELTKQPFGGARQHINHELARQRAAQLQQRHVAMLLAALGHAEPARRHAERSPAPSQRLLTEIQLELTTSEFHQTKLRHAQAALCLARAEAIMHRAIACGAMVDPWNILGFQGLYPLFNGPEDSVRDTRIDELIAVVDRLLTQYALLRGEAAAAGDGALEARLTAGMQRLAQWWDRFATATVADIAHVIGRERVTAAEHSAAALGQWRQRGAGAADLAFWRKHLENFRSAKSFAAVVETLLDKRDYRASMGLLMSWLAQGAETPLEEEPHSFHALALRWMLTVGQDQALEVQAMRDLVRRFIDHLEANAEDFWNAPHLEPPGAEQGAAASAADEDDDENALFGAAYEGVTYKDSTDDGNDSELLGFEPRQEFDLEAEGKPINGRLRFLSTAARLFHLGSRNLVRGQEDEVEPSHREAMEGWLARARLNYQDLLALMDALHQWPIPAPSGSHDSLVEFDRRHIIKQQLLNTAIGTCLETALAVGGLRSIVERGDTTSKGPRWEGAFLEMEKALWTGNANAAKEALARFLEHFQHEPLLFTPLAQGGHPRLVLRAAIAQTLLKALIASLPRLGLLREAHGALQVALTMEHEQKLPGPRITQFDQLFEMAIMAAAEAVAVAAREAATPVEAPQLVAVLDQLVTPFAGLWAKHCERLRQSALEAVEDPDAWRKLQEFIQRYGSELFHARFMTLGNLRGILQRGVGDFLKYLEENRDPLNPLRLIDDLDDALPRAEAIGHLEIVLHAVVEQFAEYRDYNTTSAKSDYGEKLHVFLDFLRLKAAYDREALLLRPQMLVHKVLVKYSIQAAAGWHRGIEAQTAEVAARFQQRQSELEQEHGMRLRTVADRIGERFVQPLVLDRICALIGPAYDEALSEAPGAAIDELEAALKPYMAAPTGSGLDVPHWLRRLEGELQLVKASRTTMAALTEGFLQIPRLAVPWEEMARGIGEWEAGKG
jgi:hypothetical protein